MSDVLVCPRCGGPRHPNPVVENIRAGRIVMDEMDGICPASKALFDSLVVRRLDLQKGKRP